MEVKSAEFVISNSEISRCPEPSMPEYAFIGRSNVGKSSLINMLTNTKKLAKTSSTPGKTQLINHFLINKTTEPWYLVDLPGYGFAKAPISEKKKWEKFIKGYLQTRGNLMCVFVLLDIRHDPQKIDLKFMEWLGEEGIPFVMTFTKADKMSNAQLDKALHKYKNEMLKMWESLPQIFVTSGESRIGKQEVLDFVGETNLAY